MARLGLHTFAASPSWDVATMHTLRSRLEQHRVRVVEIPLLDPAEIDVDATRQFLYESGIEPVCSLGLPGFLDIIENPQTGLDYLKPAFEITASLGSQRLTGVTYGSIGRTSGAPPGKTEFDGICRFLTAAARQAREHGLRLGIEPCNRYETHLINTGAQARRVCEAVGADNLFIHLDTYHMNIEEENFIQGFRDCGRFLGYVHLSESHRGIPGQGTVDWAQVYSGLTEIGFDGITTLESMNHVHPAIAAGLAIWRPVAANPEDVIDLGLPYLHAVADKTGFRYQ